MQTSVLSHFTTSPNFRSPAGHGRMLAAPRGFEPRFTDPKSAVLPLDEGAAACLRDSSRALPGQENGAEDGTRTRDPHLGKVMLYQLSHFRSNVATTIRWCREPDSNWRHRDFQSRALPTELSRPDGQPGWLPAGGPQDTTALGALAMAGPALAGRPMPPYSSPASADDSADPSGG